MVGPVRRRSHELGDGLGRVVTDEHIKSAGKRLRSVLFRKSLVRRAAGKTLKGILFIPKVILKAPLTVGNLCMYVWHFGRSMSLAEAAILVKNAASGCGLQVDGRELSDSEGAMADGAGNISGFKNRLISLLRCVGGTAKAVLFLLSLVLAKIAAVVGLLVSLPVFFIVGLILLCAFVVLVLAKASMGTGPDKAELEMTVTVPRSAFVTFKDRLMGDLRMSHRYLKAVFKGNIEEMFRDIEITHSSGVVYVSADSNSAAKICRAATRLCGTDAPVPVPVSRN